MEFTPITNKLTRIGRLLQKFNQFDRQSWRDWVSLSLVISVFGVIVFRAITVPITYDEAYTYYNTGRIQDVWQIYQFRIANTHILNSLAMTVSTLFFPFNDFMIRLPNILCGAFYLWLALGVSKKFTNQFLTLGLLIYFHYLTEFMALGRGYGMAATFLLAAYYVVKYQSHFSQFHIPFVVCLLLAFYANYIALFPGSMLALAVYFTTLKRQIPEFSKKQKRWFIGLTLLGIYGFYFVTQEGKPLYGAYESDFLAAVPTDLMKRFLHTGNIPRAMVIAVTALWGAAILSESIRTRKNIAGIAIFTAFSGIALISFVLHKPLPTGRILLPFWPLIALSIVEILEPITPKKMPALTLSLNIILTVWLGSNYLHQIDYSNLVHTYAQKWQLPLKAMRTFRKELHPEEQYYVEKENRKNLLAPHLKNRLHERHQQKAVTQILYPELGLARLNFSLPTAGDRIKRIAYGPDTQAVAFDWIPVNQDQYTYQYMLPLPPFTKYEIYGPDGAQLFAGTITE